MLCIYNTFQFKKLKRITLLVEVINCRNPYTYYRRGYIIIYFRISNFILNSTDSTSISCHQSLRIHVHLINFKLSILANTKVRG